MRIHRIVCGHELVQVDLHVRSRVLISILIETCSKVQLQSSGTSHDKRDTSAMDAGESLVFPTITFPLILTFKEILLGHFRLQEEARPLLESELLCGRATNLNIAQERKLNCHILASVTLVEPLQHG